LPFPQIYRTDGAMARQWMRISEYGYHAQSNKLTFFGVLSQHAACGCGGNTNTRHDAHFQLLTELNNHTHTSQSNIPFATDVGWSLHDH
jgi:hypothetical protein